jgi:hypothetical protein
MNSVKLVIGSIVRHVLTIAFAWLVHKGLLDQQTADSLPIAEISVGVLGIAGTLGWSLWQKAVAKWKFLQAVNLEPMNPDLAQWVVDTKPRTIPGTIAAMTGGQS